MFELYTYHPKNGLYNLILLKSEKFMCAKKIKVDLHVHSKYSEHPSQWILQRIGTKESYTEPETIYQMAKSNGMDYVTITDHNKIDGILLLMEDHKEDTFMGVEATTYFPDGCKIHLLIYDFTVEQFKQIDELRKNIYDLREYLIKNNLPHSLAHATFAVNGKLTYGHLEQLILMFDVFEGINGGRNYYNNVIWTDVLSNINEDSIKRIKKKHDIIPSEDTPWIKGITGGSDDHAGLLIGKTYTTCEAESKEDFLDKLKNRKTTAGGKHNEFYSLAFAIYKIAYDFSKTINSGFAHSFWNNINEIIFDKQKAKSLKNKMFISKMKSKFKKRNKKTKHILVDMIETAKENHNLPMDEKIERMYDNVSELSDQYFSATLNSIFNNLSKMDIINTFQKVSSTLIGIFITLPFLSTLQHMFQNRPLLQQLEKDFLPKKQNTDKKILWLTDTIVDLNGVSITLKKIGWLTHLNKKNLKIVSCIQNDRMNSELPPNLINLESIFNFTPKFYSNYTLNAPSLLKSIKTIYEEHPDELIISTPGPVGLIGMLAGKLLNIKTTAIYHSDFTMEFEKILGDGSPSHIVEGFLRWFYNSSDKILVPTKEYMNILEKRDFDIKKMSIFKRGLDLSHYYYRDGAKKFIKDYLKINPKNVILYTGRISKDKNIDFLLETFSKIKSQIKDTVFILVGDGPDLNELKKLYKKSNEIIFTGQMKQKILPFIYSAADLFVFPSTTDTFGMSVLESQACDTPALVTDIGGPKEIIKNNETGYILESQNEKIWTDTIIKVINMKNNDFESYNEMRKKCGNHIKENYDWNKLIDYLFDNH